MTNLQRLQFMLEHEHDTNCYYTWREDCGEHHAHTVACTTFSRLKCTIIDKDLPQLLREMGPALMLVALRAWAVVGGHADRPCDDSDIPRLAQALNKIGMP